uniref:ShKT domain-containing protein n=1 Tax=Acrobeloides nanus TaxID=290746 RepID=A0A914EEY2_9BILA
MTAHGGCPRSKDDNRCAKGSVLRYGCPESCGLCTENGLLEYPGECYDVIKSCPTSKDDNRCAKNDLHNAQNLRLICPESCGLCAKFGFPRPYPPNATCYDAGYRGNSCLHWKDIGICDDPQSQWYSSRQTVCAYTCGLC